MELLPNAEVRKIAFWPGWETRWFPESELQGVYSVALFWGCNSWVSSFFMESTPFEVQNLAFQKLQFPELRWNNSNSILVNDWKLEFLSFGTVRKCQAIISSYTRITSLLIIMHEVGVSGGVRDSNFLAQPGSPWSRSRSFEESSRLHNPRTSRSRPIWSWSCSLAREKAQEFQRLHQTSQMRKLCPSAIGRVEEARCY